MLDQLESKVPPKPTPLGHVQRQARPCNRRIHRQTMGSPCDAGSRCAHWPNTILSVDDLTRDVGHRTHDKTVAITYGVQTPPDAVVRMNVFRVPTGRAVDPGGAFVAGGFERFDSRSHAATVSQLGYRGIRRRGTLASVERPKRSVCRAARAPGAPRRGQSFGDSRPV